MSGYIDRGDKLDEYPFRLRPPHEQRRVRLSADELERSRADFARMIAQPPKPGFWDKPGRAKE